MLCTYPITRLKAFDDVGWLECGSFWCVNTYPFSGICGIQSLTTTEDTNYEALEVNDIFLKGMKFPYSITITLNIFDSRGKAI